jgi:hypothetical protein
VSEKERKKERGREIEKERAWKREEGKILCSPWAPALGKFPGEKDKKVTYALGKCSKVKITLRGFKRDERFTETSISHFADGNWCSLCFPGRVFA